MKTNWTEIKDGLPNKTCYIFIEMTHIDGVQIVEYVAREDHPNGGFFWGVPMEKVIRWAYVEMPEPFKKEVGE